MLYRIHFANSNSRELSWVIQGETGLSVTVRELDSVSPVRFPPSIPDQNPQGWAEVRGTLKIENGKAVIT